MFLSPSQGFPRRSFLQSFPYVHRIVWRFRGSAPCGVLLWRSIILNLPSLWAEIHIRPGYKEDQLTEHLARSKPSPLSLTFSGEWDDSSEKLIASIVSGLDRLQSIRMMDVASRRVQLVMVSLPLFMERLEVFHATPTDGNTNLEIHFLEAAAPALRSLKLSGFHYLSLFQSPFLTSVAGTLTELSLVSGSCNTNAELLLTVLQTLSHLEVLALKDVVSASEDLNPKSSEHLTRYTANLPNLRELDFSLFYLVTSYILPFLRFPPDCRVRINFLLVESLPKLSSFFSDPIQIWDQEAGGAPKWHIEFGFNYSTSLLRLFIHGAKTFTVYFGNSLRSEDLISEIYQALPCNLLRSATFRGMKCLQLTSPWMANLIHFPLLEELNLLSPMRAHFVDETHFEDVPGGYDTWRTDIDVSFSQIPTDLLPELSSLGMRNFILNESAMEDLHHWLKARAALGLGISRISMVNCRVHHLGLDSVRQIVTEVSLDENCTVL